MSRGHHDEGHLVSRIGWLRAAVLGANDGIISTASLIMGVAAADHARATILLTGIAGLAAGALAMATGEYVSVSSQADTENADRAREAAELVADPKGEHQELAAIYQMRGLDADLADRVATQLMAHDPLGAHLRDELGIVDHGAAQPVQAAIASAISFAVGAAVPLSTVLVAPPASLTLVLPVVTLVLLAVLGTLGATAGGANKLRAAARVAVWGAIAMGVTALIGRWAGAAV